MVFLYKKENIAKKKGKIRFGYFCFQCEQKFRSRRALENHQGEFWPGCPPVDNSVNKGKTVVPLM